MMTCMKIAVQDDDDRRRAPRRHLGDHGVIGTIDGTVIASCWIADISDTGARLSLFAGLGLPAEFWLSAYSMPEPWRGKIAWQIGNQVGVQFIPAFKCSGTDAEPEVQGKQGTSTIVSRILKRPLLVA